VDAGTDQEGMLPAAPGCRGEAPSLWIVTAALPY